jgi:hypothetical protein
MALTAQISKTHPAYSEMIKTIQYSVGMDPNCTEVSPLFLRASFGRTVRVGARLFSQFCIRFRRFQVLPHDSSVKSCRRTSSTFSIRWEIQSRINIDWISGELYSQTFLASFRVISIYFIDFLQRLLWYLRGCQSRQKIFSHRPTFFSYQYLVSLQLNAPMSSSRTVFDDWRDSIDTLSINGSDRAALLVVAQMTSNLIRARLEKDQ